ncbi:MAG: TSUP family transporter [Acidimicrobiia bacterium]|nr:TSUP family transporter [Acidimicrobiia bacterium]
MIDPSAFALAFAIMALAAAIQGAVGFGANLLAAPLLVLVDPAFVPVPIIVAALAMNLLVLRRDRWPDAWATIGPALPAQVLGAAAAALLLARTGGRALDMALALIILAAVALSASGLRPRRGRVTLAVGGLGSGFMGTASGIGGPPIALVLADLHGVALRASLARFFIVSAVVSLVVLGLVGETTVSGVLTGVGLVPGIVVGFIASRFLARHVDRGNVRRAVLVLSAASAALVLLRAVLV